MNSYREKKDCVCCGKSNLSVVLDLNKQPLANSYHKEDEILEDYPLGLNLCEDCYHLQLTHIVNPDLLFKDYLYVSGTTKTLRDNFKWFADFAIENSYPWHRPKNVLDIACNDGSQLDCFKSKGILTYGIDPAENLYELSSKNHTVICDYFSADKFRDIVKILPRKHEYKKFDIILAQNVFAHNETAKKFLDDCEKLMHDDSKLYIQTSQSDMVRNNQFDTIYHEHISFFNINSFNELVKRTKLHLVDVIKTPVHGVSYLFVLSKKKKNKHRVQNLIDVERELGLLSIETYEKYRNNVLEIVDLFKLLIDDSRREGYKIVGYGAAAKGMTLLNFAEVDLDVIIDDNPLKQSLLTPGRNTKIDSIDTLKQYKDSDKILFVPLAWNFYKEIRERIKKVRDNEDDVFLKYFPRVILESK